MGSCCCASVVGVTFLSAPIIRKQLREQAEANAKVQSHLVETVGGMETIKGKAWRYTVDGDGNNFMEDRLAPDSRMSSQVQLLDQQTSLEQLSGLMVLWIGASLVLNGEMTLGN